MIKYKHVASSLFYGTLLMLLIIVMTYQPGYGMEVKAPLIKEKVSPLTQTGEDIIEISNTSPSSSSGITHTSLMNEGDVDLSVANSESISYHYTEQVSSKLVSLVDYDNRA